MEENFRFMNDGWRCPKCGRVFAPLVKECSYCNKDINDAPIISTPGNTLIYDIASNTTTTTNSKSIYKIYNQNIKQPSIEAVDLGLSVKWATCNLGANKPEEFGNYYAWGETTPKDCYNWSTYKYGFYDELTKYCTDSDYGKDGFMDNKRVLDLEDDAARANWGGAWRMPTDAEWTELRENCTWTWTIKNGVNGYEVKSNINGNSIFLPAAGYRNNGDLSDAGYSGNYWSSSLYTGDPYDAWGVNFGSFGRGMDCGGSRCCGRSVRPVLK